MKLTLILYLLMTTTAYTQHHVPESIANEVKVALSYYPELENTTIHFEFKKDIKKSTMQAQPAFSSFFKRRSSRKYYIFISETVKISNEIYYTKKMPKAVLIGWIGHELGHVMDYRNRSNMNLVWFGIKYLFSKNHIIKAERAADTYAIRSGMEDYILKTKDFILNQSDIDEKYIARIKKFYLSPEEIMEVIKQRDLKLAKVLN